MSLALFSVDGDSALTCFFSYRRVAMKPSDKTSERREWFIPSATRGKPPTLAFPTTTTSKQSKKFVAGMKPLKVSLHSPSKRAPLADHPLRLQRIVGGDDVVHSRFVDLLEGLLKWRASDRISIDDALRHPFFDVKINDEGKNSIIPVCPPLPEEDPKPLPKSRR